MNMITKHQLQQIQTFALDLDWNQAFQGKSKGNRHLFRIVQKAKKIARRDRNTDITIVEAGAWLHDTNLEVTILGDTLANKKKVESFLLGLEVSREETAKIIHCIEAHDGRICAQTQEAKIVHDADTLEKMGPLGIIRETWKKSQAGWTTEQIIEHLKNHLKKRENRLYTEEAREIAQELNKILPFFFEVITEQVKECGDEPEKALSPDVGQNN